MQRWCTAFIAALCVLLAGCTTPVIRSNVTAFHEWPADLPDKSYLFEPSPQQENNLEHRSYENLVRAELQRLGFVEAANPKAAGLKVSVNYSISGRDVKVIETVAVDPYLNNGPFWPGYSFYGPPYYSPLYNPWAYGPPVYRDRETSYLLFTRQLKIVIARVAEGKKLYDVTVVSEGTNGTLAAVMPYLVRSAFADFPGKNGVPQRIEMKE